MLLRRFSLIITAFLASLFLGAQETEAVAPSGYYLGIRGGYGFLWAHRPTMSHLVNKHIPTLEISVWKTTNQTQCWHEPYNNPQSGASFTVIPLGDERLGTAFGLYPFVMLPLRKEQKKFNVNIQLGWGIGWITNKFDPIENHKNNAIGSNLNTCILIRSTLKYDCSDRLIFEAGLGMTHFSNGAMTLPNLGLNIPMIEGGFHYRIATKYEQCDQRVLERVMRTDSLVNDRRWHLTTVLNIGMNDIAAPGGNRFGIANVQATYMRNTARKHRFGGGIDIMYSQGVRHIMVYNDNPTSALQAVQVGVKFSYELVFGRLFMPYELGVYAISKYKDAGPVYNRFGARYLINDHLVASLSLKTHLARAEHWEIGMGWRL
jgi:hypothetical protein